MPIFQVIEKVAYEVVALSEEEACQIVTDAADRDKWCVGVLERYAEQKEDE